MGQFEESSKTKTQNIRVGDMEEKKINYLAPSRSALEPENASTSSPNKSRSSSLLVLEGSNAFCFLTNLCLCLILTCFSSVKIYTDIAWRLICDAEFISFARFPACRAVIVRIKKETKMPAFR